jgi:hypothetical protein
MGMAYEQKNPNLPISIPLVAERPVALRLAYARSDSTLSLEIEMSRVIFTGA